MEEIVRNHPEQNTKKEALRYIRYVIICHSRIIIYGRFGWNELFVATCYLSAVHFLTAQLNQKCSWNL